jgi:hypothetical protein
VLAATLDPDGRRVVLSEERSSHIKTRHPEMSPHLGEVMRAVREPDRRAVGHVAGEEWFLVEWSGPGRWLRVVVHFDSGEGTVITAFSEGSE